LQKREDTKKNMTFLLVWAEDNYTGSFLVIFPCIYVIPLLIYLLWLSTLFLSIYYNLVVSIYLINT
jgi:hypothetical protein